MSYLHEKGINTRPGTLSIPRLSFFKKKYKLAPHLFKNSNLLEDTTITLPIYHELKKKEQIFITERLIEALKKFV